MIIKELINPNTDLSKTLLSSEKQNRSFTNLWYSKYSWLIEIINIYIYIS